MTTQTAADRRQQAKVEFDAFLAQCPSRQVLEMLTNKWVCLVFSALADGPMRHSDLARTIAGVSQKMLTQTLRQLERDGLVSRRVTAQVPVRVDYELTPLGEDFAPVVRQVKRWAEGHIHEIHAARAAYDAAG
jgi:DNA-binding HxlR family transcriptional regulator